MASIEKSYAVFVCCWALLYNLGCSRSGLYLADISYCFSLLVSISLQIAATNVHFI